MTDKMNAKNERKDKNERKVNKQNKKNNKQVNYYVLNIFANGKNGKMESKTELIFTINPINVIALKEFTPHGKYVSDTAINKDLRKEAVNSLREWLFRKSSTPLAIENSVSWFMSPEELSDDDKKIVMNQYMFEEL